MFAVKIAEYALICERYELREVDNAALTDFAFSFLSPTCIVFLQIFHEKIPPNT